jgi:hypothetical protein
MSSCGYGSAPCGYGTVPYFAVSSGVYAGSAGARSNGFGDITSGDIANAIGQCLKGGVAGASVGTTITPGYGTAIGAGVGCVSSMLVGILTSGGASDAQAQAMVAQQQAAIQAQYQQQQAEQRSKEQQQQYLLLGGIALAGVLVVVLAR